MRRPVVALEEQLEIDSLLDREKAARKGNEYDQLYNQTQTNIKSDEEAEKDKAEEESTEPSDSPDTEGGDAPTEGNSDITDGDPALEQFRELTYATEDFSAFAQSAKEVTVLLGTMGIQFGGAALGHLYKGVIYVFTKLARLFYASGIALNKYIDRRVNSFNNLKESIEDLRKSLEAIEASKKPGDLTDTAYTQTKVINTLKIGNSVAFEANIEVLSKFVENTVTRLSNEIHHETSAISHIVSMSLNGNAETPSKLMVVKGADLGLTEGTVQGFEVSSDFVVPFRSSEVLPSDVVLIATLPKPGLTDINEIAKAYSDSSLILGVDAGSFQQVDSVPHLDLDGLKSLLGALEKLCDVCIAQHTVYDKIKTNRSWLKTTVKNFFMGLTHKSGKVSLQNSFVEYVYLKTMFVDKVYLTSAMDIHDYSAKVIATGLSFVKDHVKRMT